jgi:voltage-gated potassium channel
MKEPLARWTVARWQVNARRTFQATVEGYFESALVQSSVLLVGLLSCVTYVVEVSGGMDVYLGLDVFYFSVFAMDYMFCVAHAPRVRDYVLSWAGFADLASMTPAIGDFVGAGERGPALLYPWLGFLRFFRLLQVYHLVRLRDALAPTLAPHEAAFSLSVSEVNFQAARLAITIVVFFFLATGVIFAVSSNDSTAFSYPNQPLTFLDSLFFTVVSVTTVGYGDITAASELAKVVTMVIIVVGFTLIPAQVAELVSTVLSQPKYLGTLAMPTNCRHIVVAGCVDFELLLNVLYEVFHPTHVVAAVGANLVVVVLAPVPPSEPVRALLRTSRFKDRVKYFVGSSKSQADLVRVCAHTALAIYLVSDIVNPTSLRAEEDSVFLSGVATSRFLDQHPASVPSLRPRTLVKLTSSARNRPVLTACGIDVVLPLQEFKLAMIAFGVLFPGFLALVNTLCRSQVHDERRWRQTPHFYQSSRYCLHQMATLGDVECRPSLRRLTFPAAVRALFRKSRGQVVVVAVKRDGRVVINPRAASGDPADEVVVGDCDSLFVVAPSWEIAWEAMTTEDDAGDETDGVAGGDVDVDDGFELRRSRNAVRPRHATAAGPHAAPPTVPEEEKETPQREVFMTTASPAPAPSTAGAASEMPAAGAAGEAVQVRRLDSWVASVVRGSSNSNSPRRSLVPPCGPAAAATVAGAAAAAAGASTPGLRGQGQAGSRTVSPAPPPAAAPAPGGRRCTDLPQLRGHLVLILSSSGHAETLPASALMLPIVFFLKVLRGLFRVRCELPVHSPLNGLHHSPTGGADAHFRPRHRPVGESPGAHSTRQRDRRHRRPGHASRRAPLRRGCEKP